MKTGEDAAAAAGSACRRWSAVSRQWMAAELVGSDGIWWAGAARVPGVA